MDLAETIYALEPPPSTCACRCFRRQVRKTKAAVKLHTLLDCAALSRASSTSPTANCTMSTSSTCSLPSRRLLRDGSRLPRLRAALPPPSGRQLLCHPRQIQLQIQAPVSRPVDRSTDALRPRSRTRCILLPRDTRHGCVASAIAMPKSATGILDQSYDVGAFDHCELYRSRWQVELFFKWIKQHLRIKRFFHPENAVKTHLDRVAVYVLVPSFASVSIWSCPCTKCYRSSITPFEKIP